ncbi:MAG TPA: PAM68 family protein [Leptolyngbyaceae cyanobacterium]
MPSDSSRNSLPFEPKASKRKKSVPDAVKKEKPNQRKASKALQGKPELQKVEKKAVVSSTSTPTSSSSRPDASIPEVVSRRMLRRMIIFSGLPTALGVGIFFLSYFLLVNHIVEFPKYVVLMTTLACFGLGVLGLSYGALSASWDESRLGGWFGAAEFQVNFGRLTEAWRSSRKPS